MFCVSGLYSTNDLIWMSMAVFFAECFDCSGASRGRWFVPHLPVKYSVHDPDSYDFIAILMLRTLAVYDRDRKVVALLALATVCATILSIVCISATSCRIRTFA